jgi:transcriptional regulator with XRE-family HTH domain
MREEIGARLREERERMGMSQTAFAGIGGGSKRQQIEWEKGASTPSSEFMAVLAKAGVDVLYVLSGRREPDVPATLELYAQCWLAVDSYLQQAGKHLPTDKKHLAVEALFELAQQGHSDLDKLSANILRLAA